MQAASVESLRGREGISDTPGTRLVATNRRPLAAPSRSRTPEQIGAETTRWFQPTAGDDGVLTQDVD